MSISLWIDEEEFMSQENKAASRKTNKGEITAQKCACGRAVCCGKHKKGQCSCQNNQRQRG